MSGSTREVGEASRHAFQHRAFTSPVQLPTGPLSMGRSPLRTPHHRACRTPTHSLPYSRRPPTRRPSNVAEESPTTAAERTPGLSPMVVRRPPERGRAGPERGPSGEPTGRGGVGASGGHGASSGRDRRPGGVGPGRGCQPLHV